MQLFVLPRVVVHFPPFSILDTAFSADDDLGTRLFLKFLLRVSAWAQDQSYERIIRILFLRDE